MTAAGSLFADSAPIDWPLLSFSPATTYTFTKPVVITGAGDGSGRMFVVQQPGQVLILQNSNVMAQPFMNISPRVLSTAAEQGLLGLAFPPGFSTNQHFYVDYTRQPDGAIVVSRFFLTSTNANVADTNSEQIVKVIPKPSPPTTYNNHNGGQIAFGPDGYLYIGVGDGGSEGDPQNNGQKTNILLGKILRIDVESGVSPYAIPANNPFVNSNGYAPEIWAYGLRNPWRFSFDRLTGDLYIGDVGQFLYEEIDFQPAGSFGGQNYGWRIMEGTNNYNVPPGFTNFSALTLPVATYSHFILPGDGAGAVIGGYVYRGPSMPRMNGMYFYGDFTAGWFWGLKQSGTNWQALPLVSPHGGVMFTNISTFGQDDQAKLYFADYYKGRIYQINDSLQTWTPVFSPAGGVINSNTVMVSCLTTNAEIHYTTNGIDPTQADPMVVSGGTISVTTGFTNKARAFRSDLTPGGVVIAIYTNQVGIPFFTPPTGPIPSNTVVSIGTVTPGATIYFTTDGTTPTTNSTLYTGSITLSGNITVRALGVANGYSNSIVAVASYSAAQVAIPVFIPSSGPITNGTPISISCTTTGAVIYYTLDGSMPTNTSAVYSAPVTINGGTTVKALAVVGGYVNSPVQSVFYQLVQTASPVFNPASGPLIYGTNISITCATPGSTIYYTLDGTTPTTSSPVYSAPLTIYADTILTAYAVTPQHLDSAVRSVSYTLFKAAAPAFTPAQGPLTNDTFISISTATTNATMRYTLDGSDPNTNSSIYSGPLLFTNPITLTARAFRNDLDPSDLTSSFYGLMDFEKSVVTTLAGGPTAGYTNGFGALAKFSNPIAVCLDKAGNLYVADSGNGCIRVISPAGQVTAFNATNTFDGLSGIAVDVVTNIYVADPGQNIVWKINTSSNLTIFARIGNLSVLKTDPVPNIYAGSWASVQKIATNGTVTQVAGTGIYSSYDWGASVGFGLDSAENIYATTLNHIWKTAPDGTTQLFAGNSAGSVGGYSDGPRLQSLFQNPQDATVDGATNVFVSELYRIRRIRVDGRVSTTAGTGVAGYVDGPGTVAQFNGNAGLCVDTNGNIYVADSGNNCIREISPDTYGIGIPDWWQLAHFGYVGIDPNADPDHDGMSNYAEFWAGTDPNDPNSVFKIVNVTANSGSTQISWSSVPGKYYIVQSSTDLVTWTAVGGTVQGTGSVAQFSESSPLPQFGGRFYRIAIANF